MYYCLWTTVRVFVSTVSEIKVYIYLIHGRHSHFNKICIIQFLAGLMLRIEG